jgi:hypothetical protein
MFLRKNKEDDDILFTVYMKYIDCVKESSEFSPAEKTSVITRMHAISYIFTKTLMNINDYLNDHEILRTEDVYVMDEEGHEDGLYKVFIFDNPDIAADPSIIKLGEHYPGTMVAFCSIVADEPHFEFHYADDLICSVKISMGSMCLIDHHVAKDLTDPKAAELADLIGKASGEAMVDYYKLTLNVDDKVSDKSANT